MKKNEIIAYIEENFHVSPEAIRLICNILDYAATKPEEEQYTTLCALLDNSIGLSDSEIQQFCL